MQKALLVHLPQGWAIHRSIMREEFSQVTHAQLHVHCVENISGWFLNHRFTSACKDSFGEVPDPSKETISGFTSLRMRIPLKNQPIRSGSVAERSMLQMGLPCCTVLRFISVSNTLDKAAIAEMYSSVEYQGVSPSSVSRMRSALANDKPLSRMRSRMVSSQLVDVYSACGTTLLLA